MSTDSLNTEALRRLADAATPGPWIAHVNMYVSEFGDYHGAHIPGVADPVETEWNGAVPPLSPADADLIEAYHRAVPALLDALAAAEHRATRAEAQSAIRKKQVAYWRAETQRARDRSRALGSVTSPGQ